jgi:hypothetical protein
LLDQLGRSLAPGDRVEVPIKFLNAAAILPDLRVGDVFMLWERRVFAFGEVVSIGGGRGDELSAAEWEIE